MKQTISAVFTAISAILLLFCPVSAELDDFDVAETLLMQGKAKLAYPLATAHAKKLDTYEGYSRFVRKFPNAPRTPEILQIAYEKIKEINTERGYDDFIKLSGQSVLAFKAIADEFQLFTNTDTISEYRRFMDKFPNTPEAAEAMNRIQEIAFARAKEENTSLIFDRFLIAFPHAPQAEQAKKLACDAEQRELETEIGDSTGLVSFGGASAHEKRETAARRIYNEARIAEKKRELLHIAARKYDLLQSLFKDTKAFTDLLDRQEEQAWRQEVKDYNEQIVSEVRSVKGAVQQQNEVLAKTFQAMEEEIRTIRASVSQTQAELDNVKNSVSRTQSDLSYLSGRISDAMHAQVDAMNAARHAAEQRNAEIARANREAAREAEQARYANERMFREAQERAGEEALKNRRCAEELAQKGKYGIFSDCP